MPTDPTFDATGLTVLRTADVRENIREALRASPSFGPAIRTGPESVLGQLIDPFAYGLGQCYALLAELYDARDVAAAEGTQLDDLCALVGVTRLEATPSTVTLTLSGTSAVAIPAGTRVRVGSTGPIFETTEDTTLGALGAAVLVTAQSQDTGPVEAESGTIDTIVDAVAGWTTVTNSSAATQGRDVETDAELRVRRQLAVSIIGSGTDAAIRAQLEQVEGVLAAACISNRTPLDQVQVRTDGAVFDQDPWSFRPIVYPDTVDDALVAEVVWNNTPAGIRSYGTQLAVVTDDQGTLQTIRWDWGQDTTVQWVVFREKASSYPVDGDQAIEDAILAYVAGLSLGAEISPITAECAIVSALPSGALRRLEVYVAEGAPGLDDTVPFLVALDTVPVTESADVVISDFP